MNPIGMQLDKRPKKILVICPHPEGHVPGQRLKFEQYYQGWRSNGFEVDISPFMSEKLQRIVYKKGHMFQKIYGTIQGYFRRISDLFRIPGYDIVYVFLWVTPFGPPLAEWLFSKLAKKIVYDIDDLVYMGNTSPNNSFIKFLKSDAKVNFLMKNVNSVIVSTDKLLTYTNKYNNNVILIPATIDIDKYTPRKYTHKTVVVGWTGSHTTSKYLLLIEDVLLAVSKKFDIKIAVMGDPDFKIDNLDIELINWTADSEVENLMKFDIGLHPIPDEEWVYGKSGGKLVQYMAAGVPIVASAIGPNYNAIIEGYNGFLVKTYDEWVDKLTKLITDELLRKEMGQNSRNRAVEKYSVGANLPVYLSVFNDL